MMPLFFALASYADARRAYAVFARTYIHEHTSALKYSMRQHTSTYADARRAFAVFVRTEAVEYIIASLSLLA